MNLRDCHRLLLHHAQTNPKSSTLALVTATTLTLFTFVTAVSARDERLAQAHHAKKLQLDSSSSSNTPHEDDHALSTNEAQLAAMIENARNSTWRENLENAVDAHERFVLPNRSHDGGSVPEYVKRIDERSREMMVEDEERREKLSRGWRDTRFWR